MQAALDVLFVRRGHAAGGHRVPMLTGSLLFFMQDGGCSCPGDVAKAFGKDNVSGHQLHPAWLQHSQQRCRSQFDPECVISSRLRLSLWVTAVKLIRQTWICSLDQTVQILQGESIQWSKSYLETICQVCTRYSYWDSNTKKTDRDFFWVGFKADCNAAKSAWPEPGWMKRWWNVCWAEEQKGKAGQTPRDVLGISYPLEEMGFYLYCIS